MPTTGSNATSFVPAKISSRVKPGAPTMQTTTTTAPLIVMILIAEQNAVKAVTIAMIHVRVRHHTASWPAMKTMVNAWNAYLQTTAHAQPPTLFAHQKTLANAI